MKNIKMPFYTIYLSLLPTFLKKIYGSKTQMIIKLKIMILYYEDMTSQFFGT